MMDEIFYKPCVARMIGSSDAAIIVAYIHRAQGSSNDWVCLYTDNLAERFGLTEVQLQGALSLLREKDLILEKKDPELPNETEFKIKTATLDTMFQTELEKEN